MRRTYNIHLKDSLFTPYESVDEDQPKAFFREVKNAKDTTYYKVWLYLDGYDLPHVRKVKYRLHSSFDPPERIINRTPENTNCALVLWTWGVFKVRASVELISGEVIQLEHMLTYGEKINESNKAASKKIQWVAVA